MIMFFKKRKEDAPAGCHSINSPETVMVFVSYERDDVALQSLTSLTKALGKHRKRIRIIVSDATPRQEKIERLRRCDIDDLIWTPCATSAATSRNLATALIQDKYCPEFICFVEDDIVYSKRWYPTMVDVTRKYYGKKSPWGLAYGVFSGSPHVLFSKDRRKFDAEKNMVADIYGVAADQRFMPFHHYINVFRMWDSDILGISSCQTGSQVHRNTMRGYCAGFLHGWGLCSYVPKQKSTWIGQRDVGPPSHETDVGKHKAILDAAIRQFPNSPRE
jgi:hypothetical protein